MAKQGPDVRSWRLECRHGRPCRSCAYTVDALSLKFDELRRRSELLTAWGKDVIEDARLDDRVDAEWQGCLVVQRMHVGVPAPELPTRHRSAGVRPQWRRQTGDPTAADSSNTLSNPRVQSACHW